MVATICVVAYLGASFSNKTCAVVRAVESAPFPVFSKCNRFIHFERFQVWPRACSDAVQIPRFQVDPGLCCNNQQEEET